MECFQFKLDQCAMIKLSSLKTGLPLEPAFPPDHYFSKILCYKIIEKKKRCISPESTAPKGFFGSLNHTSTQKIKKVCSVNHTQSKYFCFPLGSCNIGDTQTKKHKNNIMGFDFLSLVVSVSYRNTLKNEQTSYNLYFI